MKYIIIGLAILLLVPSAGVAAITAIDFLDFLEEWWEVSKTVWLGVGITVAILTGVLFIANGLTGGALW